MAVVARNNITQLNNILRFDRQVHISTVKLSGKATYYYFLILLFE